MVQVTHSVRLSEHVYALVVDSQELAQSAHHILETTEKSDLRAVVHLFLLQPFYLFYFFTSWNTELNFFKYCTQNFTNWLIHCCCFCFRKLSLSI